jgi:integrase
MNYDRARAHVERVRTEAREGRLALAPKGRKLHLTFGEVATRYLDALVEGGGKNIAKKRQQLAQHLVPALGDERLSSLTRSALDRYRQQRLDEGASDATVNREMATVSHLLTVATDEKWISVRPCKVPKVAEPEAAKIILSGAEQQALLQAAMNDIDSYVYLFVLFGINTPMRHSEILSSRYDEVDFDNNLLTVPDAKAGPRIQPLTAELVAALQRERDMATDEAGWIFPSLRPKLSECGHRSTMARSFARVVKAAGLRRHAWPHLMRHTAVSRLIKAGVDLKTVQAISGHKTMAMLLRYLQTSAPEISRAMQHLGQGLPGSYQNAPAADPEPVKKVGQNVVIFKKGK